MGDRGAPRERERTVRWQHMRIRTVTVSFAAAVASAHRDLEVGAAERDALIETWRAWSLGVLEGYRAELDALRAADADASPALRELDRELERALAEVRRA